MIRRRILEHPGRFRRGHARRGYSLIEMLASIAIISLVLTSVGVALTSMFRAESECRERAARRAIHGRLELQLRGDGHRAVTAEQLPESAAGTTLLLKGDGSWRVEYRITGRSVHRTTFENDARKHHEAYRLAADETASFQIDTAGQPTAVTLTTQRKLDTRRLVRGAMPTERIIVVIGMDRLATSG